jgi:hypothetical protein
MPVILATWEVEIGRILVSLGKQFETPISKITSEKWTGGVAQVALQTESPDFKS